MIARARPRRMVRDGVVGTLRPGRQRPARQTFGRERADRIQQPIVEPLWLGLRVIVAASAEAVTILDDGTAHR